MGDSLFLLFVRVDVPQQSVAFLFPLCLFSEGIEIGHCCEITSNLVKGLGIIPLSYGYVPAMQCLLSHVKVSSS